MIRRLTLVAVLLTLAVVPHSGTAEQTTVAKHVMPTIWNPGPGGIPVVGGGVLPQANRQLLYNGGVGGIGVETDPKVYLVYWNWTSDPSNVKPYLEGFLSGVAGTSWNNSIVQYCQNVPRGTTNCAGIPGAEFATNPTGKFLAIWSDDTNTVPSAPSDSQMQQEAVRAAEHFGNLTPDSNVNADYVIATPTRHSNPGFGSYFCAWHWAVSSSYGNIGFTNLPYIPDAGFSCGQNFVNPGQQGTLDGVSIVEGHEMTETETDQFADGGWYDSAGYENADKCVWIRSGQGAAANLTLSTGVYAVQSLWSNAYNNNAGGCVNVYP